MRNWVRKVGTGGQKDWWRDRDKKIAQKEEGNKDSSKEFRGTQISRHRNNGIEEQKQVETSRYGWG